MTAEYPERRDAFTKPDKRGRDGKRQRKRNPPAGPRECGVEHWAWEPAELIRGGAFRALSRAARLVLDRVKAEHVAHGGVMNGELVVAHSDFEAHGVGRNLIAAAIWECEAAGVLAVRRRGKIAGLNVPNLFRLTWIGARNAAGDIVPPSNEWKGRTAEHVERAREQRKREKAALKSGVFPRNVVALASRKREQPPDR